MSRPIRISTPIPRPVMAVERAFRVDPSAWLPQPYDHPGRQRWLLYLWAGKVGLLVDTAIGGCRRERGTLRRSVHVEPDRSSFVGRHAPRFIGDMAVCRENGCTVVALEGSYQPPYGRLGDLLDRLVMHRVAHATARRFGAEAATRLAATASPTLVVSEVMPEAGPLL